MDIKFPPFPPFENLQLPRSIFWALLWDGFRSVWRSYFWGKIGLNLRMVTQVLLVQGHPWYTIFGKYIRSRFWLTIIVVFVALQPLLSLILSWVGVFDFCFDLRKIRGK